MVLPVHDDNPTRRRSIVTLALLGINIVVFLLSPFAGHFLGDPSPAEQCKVLAYLDEFAVKPSEVLTNRADNFATTGEVAGPSGGESCRVISPPPYDKIPFLSVLTAMFVHAGWLHLLGNMLFLWVFGNNIEDRLGRLRFLGFYLLCGYVATYGFALVSPGSGQLLVGASGAVAGVLGGYLVLYPRARILSLLTFLFFLPIRLPAWLVLGSWFALQYVYFRGGGVEQAEVAYGAHVIGFVAGVALIWSRRGSGGAYRRKDRHADRSAED